MTLSLKPSLALSLFISAMGRELLPLPTHEVSQTQTVKLCELAQHHGEGGWECGEAVLFVTVQKLSQAQGNESLVPRQHTPLWTVIPYPHTQATLTLLSDSAASQQYWSVGGFWLPLLPPEMGLMAGVGGTDRLHTIGENDEGLG